MIGLRRFLYPHHAMSGFAIVCDKLTGMAHMPMIGGRRFSFSRYFVFDTGCRGADNRFMSYPSPRAPSCLLAARLTCAVSSHHRRRRLDRRFDRLLPAPRHGWRGVRRGASGVLCLLDFILRSVPISADVDSQFVPFPSSAVSSLDLLALSARLRGR